MLQVVAERARPPSAQVWVLSLDHLDVNTAQAGSVCLAAGGVLTLTNQVTFTWVGFILEGAVSEVQRPSDI